MTKSEFLEYQVAHNTVSNMIENLLEAGISNEHLDFLRKLEAGLKAKVLEGSREHLTARFARTQREPLTSSVCALN